MKKRLDSEMFRRGLTPSRSAAESWIKLGRVRVNGALAVKSGLFVDENTTIKLAATERYVSRAGLKLASVVGKFGIDFTGKIVLDVGSSTGGFTDYALQHDAAKVIAVDVGTGQMHPSLRHDERIELHEKTDIRDVVAKGKGQRAESKKVTIVAPDIVVIDVSFISLRDILPHISSFILRPSSLCLAMVKPQFEAGRSQVSKGVIKNDRVRREILHDFEVWARRYFVVVDKADSEVSGTKGNQERFYCLRVARK